MSGTAIEPFTFLWCIAINNRRQVLCKPFQLAAPLNGDCDIIFIHLRIAIPSLRSGENEISSIHKPCRHMMSSEELPEFLDEAHVDPSTAVTRTALVQEVFPVVPINTHQNISIIIYLSNSGAYFFIPSALLQ
jgi:hypothetical protein